MSHSKEEEEIEDIKCLLDHLDILNNNIKNIKYQLTKANKTLTKKEMIKLLKKADKENDKIGKRLVFIIKDLEGEINE